MIVRGSATPWGGKTVGYAPLRAAEAARCTFSATVPGGYGYSGAAVRAGDGLGGPYTGEFTWRKASALSRPFAFYEGGNAPYL